jgi:hypothetical protein
MANYTTNLLQTLYYLLYAKYGNSAIASSDVNQFKYKVFSTIFEYAPAWAGRLKVQEKLFNINLDAVDPDYLKGTMVMYNHAMNPDTEPTTSAYDALDGINRQTVQTTKRGMLEGYATLLELINTDVTAAFLSKFKKLFLTVVMPQAPLWYRSIGDPDVPIEEGVILDDPNSSLFGNYLTNTFQQIWETYEDFEADYRNCGIPATI